MALPVTIPNTFANATSSIPLSQLDTNFSTLANAVNGLNSGSETLANLKATTANVGVLTVTGNATIGDASTDTVTLNSTLTANTAVIFAAGTSAAPSITTTGDTNTGIFFPAADTIAFAEGGAEAMRIDSDGDVGIGTTSPARKLHVDGGASATYIQLSNNASGSTNADGFQLVQDGVNCGLINREAGYMSFDTSNQERMRIDSSGNVGIGVTPSAWYVAGGTKALQIGARGSLFSFSGTTTDVGNNVYQSAAGDYSYIASATTSIYRQSSGSHQWFTAPSGTAGSAITFTQVLAVEKDKSLALQGATSQTGTGITFPATQSASSDANTLDDYEEGTWTPTFTATGRTFTYGNQQGFYTKIGRYVFAQFYLRATVDSATATDVGMAGLPFTTNASALNQSPLCVGYIDFVSPDYSWLVGYTATNATTATILWTNSDTITNVQADNFPTSGAGSYLVGTFIYFTS